MRFTINVEPVGQRRARSGKGFVYKDKLQRSREAVLAAALFPHRPETPLTGPVKLTVRAYFKPPKNRPPDKRGGLSPREWRAAAWAGHIPHTSTPDLDNLFKHLKDVMTQLQFWTDDALVCAYGRSGKWYGEPRWEIEIEPVAFSPSQQAGRVMDGVR